jgi:uncharacterized protein YjbI with pentapeptide repeats
MREDITPFEYREINGITALCLYGKDYNNLVVVDEDKTQIIMDAIADGINISIQFAIIEGKLDISSIADKLENDDKGRAIIKGKIAICYSEFSGDANFMSASFNNAYFMSTSFNGDTYFNNSTFIGDADFKSSSFNNVYFNLASFNSDTYFRSAYFSGYANFNSASFNNVYFSSASFNNVYFSSASFNSDTYFNSASFNSDTYFRSAYFNGYTYFNNATFSSIAEFGHSQFNLYVNLAESNLDKVSSDSLDSIGNAYVRSSISGAHYFFQMAGDRYWNNGEYQEASDSFRNAKVEYEKEGNYDEAAIMFRNVGDQYLNLKNYTLAENSFREARIEYNNGGKYGEAGKMYVMEQEAIRLSLKSNNSNHAIMAWLWILKHTCNYGESPKLLIRISIIIVLWFALIYLPIMPDWWIFPITFNGYPFHNWFGHGNVIDNIINGIGFNIGTAIYYSIVTLLSFGDLTPVNLTGKLWIGLEVICGYVMFGILITLVARKMTRS